MKKTIAILLVLVLAGVGLFAVPLTDNQTELELKTAVGGQYAVKISSDEITTTDLASKISTFKTLSEVTSATFDDSTALDVDLYVSYLSNQKIQAKVSVSAAPMASSDTSTKIGYIVSGSFTDSPVTVDATKTITFYDEGSVVNGMRVFSKAIKIAMIQDDWTAATAADNYTTTWTVNLTSN